VATAQEFISGLMSTLVYVVIAFAVIKVYAISVEVSEIKELLRDIKRNTEDRLPPAVAAHAVSPESLVRAIHASSYPASGYSDSEIEAAGEITNSDAT
jgi:hypothetical protein